MLQIIWNSLAYLGVDHVEDDVEQKYVVLLNSLTVIVVLFSASLCALSFFTLSESGLEGFLWSSAAYALLLPVTLKLNRLGHLHAARMYFTLLSFLMLSATSIYLGIDTGFQNYLLTGIVLQFFLFPAGERRYAHIVGVAAFLFYVGIQIPGYEARGLAKISAADMLLLRTTNSMGVGALLLAFAAYISYTFHTSERYLHAEKAKSERLLLNILPAAVAAKLRESPDTIAERFEHCTVLFSDIVGFTELSRRLSATEVVELLNQIFSAFDDLADKHELEKIKTIGDSYMVVGGLPEPHEEHAERVARFALEMLDVVRDYRRSHDYPIELRIGISSGDAVAGVIGKKKFVYDLWGDNVNTASRMESHGLPGRVQVTESTYRLLKDKFNLEERGTIDVKGLGPIRSYLLSPGPA